MDYAPRSVLQDLPLSGIGTALARSPLRVALAEQRQQLAQALGGVSMPSVSGPGFAAARAGREAEERAAWQHYAGLRAGFRPTTLPSELDYSDFMKVRANIIDAARNELTTRRLSRHEALLLQKQLAEKLHELEGFWNRRDVQQRVAQGRRTELMGAVSDPYASELSKGVAEAVLDREMQAQSRRPTRQDEERERRQEEMYQQTIKGYERQMGNVRFKPDVRTLTDQFYALPLREIKNPAQRAMMAVGAYTGPPPGGIGPKWLSERLRSLEEEISAFAQQRKKREQELAERVEQSRRREGK